MVIALVPLKLLEPTVRQGQQKKVSFIKQSRQAKEEKGESIRSM
jgi:hypothetical protein